MADLFLSFFFDEIELMRLLDTALPYRVIKNYTSHQFYLVKKEREKKVRRF
jgi:hypothetical protein